MAAQKGPKPIGSESSIHCKLGNMMNSSSIIVTTHTPANQAVELLHAQACVLQSARLVVTALELCKVELLVARAQTKPYPVAD